MLNPKNFVRNYLVADQAIVSALNYALLLVVASLLGPASLSVYVVLLSICYLLINVEYSAIVSFLFTNIKREDMESCGNNILLHMMLTLLLIIVLLIGYIVLPLFFPTILEFGHIDMYAFIVLFVHHEYVRKFYIFTLKNKKLLMVDVFVKIAPLLYLYLFNASNVQDFIGFQVIVYIASAIFFYKNVSNFIFTGLKNFNFKGYGIHGGWLSMSVPIQWANGNMYIYASMFTMGATFTGYLLALKNIVGLSSFISQIYENHVTPMVSQLKGVYLISTIKKESTNLLLLLLIFLAIILIGRDEIISTIYGQNYTEYSHYVLYFSIIVVFEYLHLPYQVLLRIVNRTRDMFNNLLMVFVINLTVLMYLFFYFPEYLLSIGIMMSQFFYLIFLARSVHSRVDDFKASI